MPDIELETAVTDKDGKVRLTEFGKALTYERMSGERLSDADRQHVLNGGEFVPPHMRKKSHPQRNLPKRLTEV